MLNHRVILLCIGSVLARATELSAAIKAKPDQAEELRLEQGIMLDIAAGLRDEVEPVWRGLQR